MDAEPSLLFLFLSLIGLLILSAFFSGSETGMMAANKIKLKNLIYCWQLFLLEIILQIS